MKRDVGYAIVAALSLTTLAALWALVKAPELADPEGPDRARGSSGSVPLLPRALDNSEAIEQATAVLETRDLFRAAAPADMATLNRLSAARIAPPVELVPVEAAPTRRIAAAPPPPVYRPAPPRIAPVVQSTPSIARPPAPPTPPAPPQTQPDAWQSPALPPASTSQQVITVRDGRFPLTLRGVFPDVRTGGRTHVALPNGRVVSAGPGGVIEGYRVVQINAASIIVQGRGGPRLRLEMPGY